jgi:hypothetical protein
MVRVRERMKNTTRSNMHRPCRDVRRMKMKETTLKTTRDSRNSFNSTL